MDYVTGQTFTKHPKNGEKKFGTPEPFCMAC